MSTVRSRSSVKLEPNDNVLIIAAGHTGNNIFCTPAIHFLKKIHPDIKITVVALKKLSAQVFENNPSIHQLRIINKASALKNITEKFVLAICLNEKSEFLLKDVGIPKRMIGRFEENRHLADQTLEFMSDIVNRETSESDRRYQLVSKRPKFLDDAKYRELLRGQRKVIGIHLGCGRTNIHGWKFFYRHKAHHKKMWPTEKYIQLGELLSGLYPNIEILITGTSNEEYLGRQFEKHIPNVANLIGRTSANELYYLINQMDLFLTHDCGVLHIASATESPIVALFGCTNILATGPYPEKVNHRLIQRDSLAQIEVEDVLVEVSRLLTLADEQPGSLIA